MKVTAEPTQSWTALAEHMERVRKELPRVLERVLDSHPDFILREITESNHQLWETEGVSGHDDWRAKIKDWERKNRKGIPKALIDTGDLRESMESDARLNLTWEPSKGIIRWVSDVDYSKYVGAKFTIYTIDEEHTEEILRELAGACERYMKEVWDGDK